jgi:hypothetical protein
MTSPLRDNFMLPPTIIPSVNAARSHSIPIPRITWSCLGCKKVMQINDDDLIFASEKVKYCAKCRFVLNGSLSESILKQKQLSRVIDSDKKEKEKNVG